MKTEKLNSWLTLGANVGVLIGLILLVFELRQNSDLMRAQMSQSRSETTRAGLQSYMDSPYIPAIRIKVEDNEDLSREEYIRYNYYFLSFMSNMNNLFWQYNEGHLSDEIPYTVASNTKRMIGRGNIGLELWDRNKSNYSVEFVAFVEEAIADLR